MRGPAGWVTLASVARASQLLARLEGEGAQRALLGVSAIAAAAMCAEIAVNHTDGGVPVATYAAAIAVGLCLAACLRRPAAATLGLAAVVLADAVPHVHLLNVSAVVAFAVMIVIFVLAARTPSATFRPAFAVLAISVELTAQIDSPDDRVGTAVWVTIIALAFPAIAGRALRWRTLTNEQLEAQADELDRNREARARAAVSAERTRIANDLHDVVAHDVAVMLVQAEAAARLVTRAHPDAADSIESIEATGRETLNEMRSLLGVLRSGEDAPDLAPLPTLQDTDTMMQRARESGLAVELTRDGEARALAPGLDLTGYRILQETLSDVAEHGGATHAAATIAFRPGELRITLAADGAVTASCLAGIRERARIFGGTVATHGAGQRTGGVIEVALPLTAAAVPA